MWISVKPGGRGGAVSQIHYPHLLAGAPGIFSGLLRSVKMLKREWGAETNGKLQHLFIPSKTTTLISEFAVPSYRSASLVLNLQWKTGSWAENTDVMIIYREIQTLKLL